EYSYEQNAEKAGLSVEEYKASLDLLDKEEIAGVLDQLNANNEDERYDLPSADELYKNVKIPFAYNYVDASTDTDHSGDSQGEHGSHVSGIAAANRYVKKDGGYADAIAEVGAVGMAPDAQIITMKVFGLYGGAYDSDYMAAIEDAIILGADVINLSLGSAAPGFSFSETYQSVMDGLEECGAVVSISAGNSYAADSFYEYTSKYADDTSFNTVGSPGSFINSLAVASADNIGEAGRQIVFDGSVHAFFTDTSGENAFPSIITLDGTIDYVYIDSIGTASDYEAVNEEISLAGKVVIVNRGENTFAEKGNNLISYDPAALIVANNQAGTIYMSLESFTGDFPMCGITLADAEAVKAEAEADTVGEYDVYTGSLEVTKDIQSVEYIAREDAAVSEFSSWGVPDSLILKPEITAPGGSIWSVNGMTDDGFEMMSGTSMAAPHIAGLSAVAAQYIRENDVLSTAREVSGMTELTQRALIQSLLMSTATPMLNDGLYLPVIQVGAGLADIGAATSAKSFILMDDNTTASAADGKVKAELGQNAERERRNEYEYSFTVNNLSDEFLTYSLSTDLFTQDTFYNGYFLDYATVEIPADVEYTFDYSRNQPEADVDLDGDLDFEDVQAVLDYVTGLKTGEEIDTDSADFDDDGSVTSLDAELILQYLMEYGPVKDDELSVPANGSVKVNVKITVTDPSVLDREGGAYIEGYTYLTSTKVSEEGEILDVEHSVPILGYYGSWTDSTMFDNGSFVDTNYTGKVSYFGNEPTGELIFTLNGKKFRVEGNPYAVEDEFPADRVAVNGNAVLKESKYTLIRNAADLHAVVMQDGSVLQRRTIASNPHRAFYYVDEEAWMYTDVVTEKIGFDLSSLGLSDGDRITVGLLAVPEYYALMLDPQTDNGSISLDKAAELYAEGEIGKGALLGYEFTLDSEAPEILAAEYSEENNTITVRVKDNLYLAYLAVCDVGGSVIYLEAAPNCSYAYPLEQSEPGGEITLVFDLSEAVDESGNPVNVGSGVAVFAGDYAGNEKAVLVRLAEGPVPMVTVTDVFVLTDELEAGKEYLILNTDEEGDAYALTSCGADYYTASEPVSVQLDEYDIPYVDAVSAYSVWQAFENSYEEEDEEDQAKTGTSFYNDETGVYLGYHPDYFGYPFIGWDDPDFYPGVFSYDPETHLMTLVEEPEYGLCFADLYGDYYFLYDESTEVYLYVRTTVTVEEEVDPEEAYAVTVDPEEVTLFLADGLDSTQVYAEVSPIVLEDRTVSWFSLDESVATVDENGVITARGYGETYVAAASNKTPSVMAAVHVTVPEGSPIEQSMYAQITVDGIPQWVLLNGNMTYETILEVEEWELTGGGRSGDWVYGIDTDKYLDRFDP
ncbi:MAG: S8 family serine peptidase, partial [Clostridiales bacterium]|nr:S8 family serine peptidase [Clostridiales bacterium]